MSEEKKKMYYYYGGKEKKASEIKKQEQEGIVPYSTQKEFDRMMERFQREFDDLWRVPPRMMNWINWRHRFPMMPFREEMLPSVDVEDRGKDFCLTVDLPGFKKENVDIEVADDWVTIHAKKTYAEEEKKKNYVRKERAAQTYYRTIRLPEKVMSDDAKASLNNGILEIILPKKEPKETKKLTVT